MRRRRSPWAWDLARDTWLDLRFALMATMTTIRTLAPPMDFTGRAILSAACSSAQAPGITAMMDRDITGILTMVTAGATTAMATAGAMVTGEATAADITGTDSMAVEATTVVADSTADMAVAGN